MTLRYCRFILILLFTSVFVSQRAAAQITIRAEDFAGHIGQSSTVATYSSEDSVQLQAIVDATGESQTYDFTNVSISDTLQGAVSYHGEPDDLPAGEDYPSSNYAMALQLGVESATQDSTVWIFNRIDDDALYTLGGAFVFENPNTGEDDTLSFAYDPPRLNFPLPASYGDQWSDTTAFFGSEMLVESEIEGWGTLVTPFGSYDALRVRMTTTTSSFGFTTQSHDIQFVTKNNEASAQISLSSDGQTAVSAEIASWAVSTASEADELPKQVSLEQNYPNPFNPSTTLAYELDASGHVRLTVHDVLGRTVAVLVDALRPAGEHTESFDASGLPSGTYIYRLQSNAGTHTRAMTLAR